MVLKKLIAAALVASVPLAVSPVAAAAVRPGMVALPSASANVSTLSRSSTRMDKKSSVFGAPIFLLVLGAVAVTAGIVAVADSGSSSPN